MEFSLTEMQSSDWEEVRSIFIEGISTGNATFEKEAPTWEEWNDHFITGCRLVARSGSEIVGWAALSPVSSRCVYEGVAEISIYVAAAARGQGAGRSLLERLIKESENAGFWTLQAGIFPENKPSLELVKSCGLRVVGTRERLGQMGGKWRDVVIVERRSSVIK
ncbi:MAG: N-acetyltransferase [Actinobacteria bacterium]|jgi:phosphinothricin acetyltransferase|nr:MAG: N-acetyltransferase [Actinomycetota bacterium]